MAHNLTITGAMLSLLVASGLPALADDASTAPAAVLGTIVKGPPANASANDSSAVQLKLQYTGEAWYNAGGSKTGTDFMHAGDASLSIDGDKLGWAGSKFYAEGFYVTGKSLDSVYTGAWSPPSALDVFGSTDCFRLYQMFYEQKIAHTDILVGIYDMQQQFGATQPSDVFFNRAFGWNQALGISGIVSGLNQPSSYPNTTLGLRIKQQINDQWTAKFGLVNGMADDGSHPRATDILINSHNGVLALGEVDYSPFARTKLMAGYWGYTSKFADFASVFARPHASYGTSGGYVGANTRVYTIEGSRGVDTFINLGAANSSVNIVDRSLNGGVTVTGLFDARPHDKLGFAVNVMHLSTPYQTMFDSIYKLGTTGDKVPEYETDFELTYHAAINDWLVIQPDIQYIIHPAIASNGKNALVFGVHLELSKLFNL
jgi:porin